VRRLRAPFSFAEAVLSLRQSLEDMMRRSAFIFGLLIAGFSTAALADAIDGDWCNLDGSHLRIEGPRIELAPGQFLKGKYNRHTFSYVAPNGDPEAGAEIMFVLRSEEEMRRMRTPDAMPEHEDIWRRCEATS
jgi:hypothetical protein